MTDLLITVPSKNRADVLLKNTWAWLQHLPYEKRIVIEPQDRDAYCKAGFEQWLHVLPDNDRGLGYALTHIKALAQPFKLVFKLDDDVRSWSRGHGDPESEAHSVQLITQALEADVIPALLHGGLAAATFDYLQFHRIEPSPSRKWIFCSRLRSVYVIHNRWFQPLEEISALEDLYATAQVWSDGGLTACYVPIAQRTNLYSFEGGHQSPVLRRAQANQRETALMVKRFPLVEVMEGKPNTNRWSRSLRKAHESKVKI
jgi:hypothetical protein